ncbi:MAG TPA: hypothetical protein VGX68_01125 [Thermoanaerobaculia bacterium]|jgi:ABC-type phosphate transport system substrate-binding protein|nr:hypothetical protein [Thermoanaerobaculia bacterium]
MRKALAFGLFLSLAVFAAAAETPAQFVVIVNAENTTFSTSKPTVAGMFLKRIGKWESGLKCQPVDLAESSGTREAFSRQILGRRIYEVEQYWQTAIFSGRDIPPPKKVSEAEVVAYVAHHPGAIGYVSPGTPLPPQVKVLRVVER